MAKVAKNKRVTIQKMVMKDGRSALMTGNLRKELTAFGKELDKVKGNTTQKYKDAVDATNELIRLLTDDCQKNLNFTSWAPNSGTVAKKK